MYVTNIIQCTVRCDMAEESIFGPSSSIMEFTYINKHISGSEGTNVRINEILRSKHALLESPKWLIRVRGLGYPERLISSLGAGACGVVGAEMFVVVLVSVVVSVVVVVVTRPGGSRDPAWTHGPHGPHGPNSC